jgi:hypothetical protein
MPTKPRAAEPTGPAQFVFQGTVQKVKAATMAQVPVSERTAVVRVDRLLQAPEALSDYQGEEITVQLPPNAKVTVGQTLIFHTNSWIFGDSLAVQAVTLEQASPSTEAAMSSHPDDPVQSLHTRRAMAEAAAADLIVSGRVTAVRLPAAESQARATAVAGGRTAERISEHAPLWQEAVIDIDDVHKGQFGKGQVVIRFPASTDVRWRNAPKFHTGQEGVFLLHRDQLQREAHPAALAAPLGTDEYTALHAADFQPLEELPRILLAASGGSDHG